MTIRMLRLLLRLAERRGYERGMAQRRPESAAVRLETGRLPDGTVVGCTVPGLLRGLWPDADIL